MMVVVPAFPHGDHGQKEIVSAVVARDIPLRSVDMRKGVDRARPVNQRHGGHKKSPNQHLRAVRAKAGGIGFKQFAKPKHRESCHCGDDDIESVKKAQFRVLGEILNGFQPRCEMRLGRKPAHMRPEKPTLPGGVHIIGAV